MLLPSPVSHLNFSVFLTLSIINPQFIEPKATQLSCASIFSSFNDGRSGKLKVMVFLASAMQVASLKMTLLDVIETELVMFKALEYNVDFRNESPLPCIEMFLYFLSKCEQLQWSHDDYNELLNVSNSIMAIVAIKSPMDTTSTYTRSTLATAILLVSITVHFGGLNEHDRQRYHAFVVDKLATWSLSLLHRDEVLQLYAFVLRDLTA